MGNPGAHRHFAVRPAICSMNKAEREKANEYGARAVDLAYGTAEKSLVKRGSALIRDLERLIRIRPCNDRSSGKCTGILKKTLQSSANMKRKRWRALFRPFEPKPNEGHPAMLLPTVASAIVFWKKLEKEFGIDIKKKGTNKEFGHSEMIGLDHVYDTVEEIDNNMLGAHAYQQPGL